MSDWGGQNRTFRLVWLMRASSLLLLGIAGGLYWQSQASVRSRGTTDKGWWEALSGSAAGKEAAPARLPSATASGGATGLKASSRRGSSEATTSAFWLSSTEAEQRRQRVQCDELAEALEQLAGVRRARVFVNVAAGSGFQASSAQAAVLIEPQVGGHLPRSLVEAVRRLLCGAVANLSAEKITVIDARSGRVLDLPTGLSVQAVAMLDEAALRQASNAQARISEGLADMEGARVEVWPAGPPSDEQLAGFVIKGAGISDWPAGNLSGGGGERTQALTWHLAARIIVPGEEVYRREPQAAESPEAWQRAQDRLISGLRVKVSQVAPTILPEEIAVEVLPPGQQPPTPGRLTSPHVMVGLVICALMAGFAWGRPIRRSEAAVKA